MDEKPVLPSPEDGGEGEAEAEAEAVVQPVDKKPIYEVDQQFGHYGRRGRMLFATNTNMRYRELSESKATCMDL